MLVFDWRNSLLYQNYSSISTRDHTKHQSANDLFLFSRLSTSVLDFGLELEAVGALTRKQQGTIDHLDMTFKYVWWDDVAGDPFSLTTGISLIQAFQWSVRDISSFHHGKAESEIFISVGKETACMETWIRRWSSTVVLGLADTGSPWLRFNWEYAFKFACEQEWKLFCCSLFGLGNRQLNINHFQGYGAVRHQSVDLGFCYTYLLDCVGKINFQYSHRLYSKNFPASANLFWIEFLYDFGIDSLCF